jgi:hypothetical protein
MRLINTFIFSSVLVASGLQAQPSKPAFCQIGGTWTIVHGNGATAIMKVQQDGNKFTGIGREGRYDGDLSGYIQDNQVEFEIAWTNGQTGQYQGQISSRQRFSGSNNNKASPNQQTTWFVKERKRCTLDPKTGTYF